MRTLLRVFVCLLGVAIVGGASASETFRFWPGKGAASAPGFQGIGEHPCGEVAEATVSKLPTARNGRLIPEVVVELDRRGKIVRRWPMPVDYTARATPRGTARRL
jgi:hypothetical protein